ncbi:serine O-acetyltransferase [Nitrincola iocasae]|uniref:Serine acetyltransferase n=1 Tax=Nitrincola iocasae TaxID=2614693 RepID=A0A5J6LDC4_9GAMM|nr:serine acetyltransferase [Nitrincola iocasae]QEW06242.1 serine acetyltransferase [Nitrincola iocasae]
MPEISPPVSDGRNNENPSELSFINLLKEDYATHGGHIFNQGFFALLCHRFGNWRMSFKNKLVRAPLTLMYLFLRQWCQIFCGIQLDYIVKVGRRVKIEHFGGIIINARQIGDDVIIRQNTTIGIKTVRDPNGRPIIGNRVDIGAGAVIVGNIIIGDDVVIGANSVVSFDVPSGSIVKLPRAEVFPRQDLVVMEGANSVE